MPKDPSIKKVILIGSGPIQIGQAAEFDFSGSQACRALREEGVEVVLVNSNPATIQTDPDTADIIYVEPLQADVIAKIIAKEKPDGIMSGMGGQTGLNLTAELAEMGALEGVRILGTPLKAIYEGEDREKFRDLMQRIGEPVPKSMIVSSLSQLDEAAKIVGLIGEGNARRNRLRRRDVRARRHGKPLYLQTGTRIPGNRHLHRNSCRRPYCIGMARTWLSR